MSSALAVFCMYSVPAHVAAPPELEPDVPELAEAPPLELPLAPEAPPVVGTTLVPLAPLLAPEPLLPLLPLLPPAPERPEPFSSLLPQATARIAVSPSVVSARRFRAATMLEVWGPRMPGIKQTCRFDRKGV
jgi:hypothetical protein